MFDYKNNSQHEIEPTSCTGKEKVDANTRENVNKDDLKESSKTEATKVTKPKLGESSDDSAVKSDIQIKTEVSVSSQNITPIEPCQSNPALFSSKGKAENIKPNGKNKNIDNDPPSSKDNETNVTSKDKQIGKKKSTLAIKDDKETVKPKDVTKDTDLCTPSCKENKETVKSKGKTEDKNNEAPSSENPHMMNMKTDETKETLV